MFSSLRISKEGERRGNYQYFVIKTWKFREGDGFPTTKMFKRTMGQVKCSVGTYSICPVRRQHGGAEEALKGKSGDLSSGASTGPTSATIHQWRLLINPLISLDLRRLVYKIRRFAK